VERGDDVPGGASAGQVVERGELAGELVRLVEGGVERSRQAQVGGDGGERGEHRQRVGASDDVLVEDLPGPLAQGEAFGEEEEVEPAAFGGAGGVLEGREVDLAARLRVPPGGVVVHA